jgi:carotenoid cleavage dioxygenase-like enzyme
MMNQALPENRFLQGIFAPIDQEYTLEDLPITGAVPTELNGSFYRNGPNQKHSPIGDYHLFAGDGMSHVFHITDGKVSYCNRWIETAKYRLEQEQGRAVIDPMNPFNCEEGYVDFVLTDREGLANTACIWHAGKLLILEEAHLPFEVDPKTLKSIGSYNFDGKLPRAMTAHPKVDPVSGDMVFFAYMASDTFASDMEVYRVNPQGELTDSIRIPTAYPAMVHDFVVTENYIVIPVFPLTGSMDRAIAGGPPLAWEPEKGASVCVIPRDDFSEEKVRWIECDPVFIFHYMNAYDENGVLTIDACQFEHAPLFPDAEGNVLPDSPPVLHRWTIDLNEDSPQVQIKKIDSYESEFPQVDPRYATKKYRYGFYTSPEGDDGLDLYNAVARYDHQDGSVERYSFGDKATTFTSEAIFVPRSDDGPEGDGFLLSVVTDMSVGNSALYIMDAQDLSSGPVAVAQLDHRVPVGFHGGWKPTD